MYSRQSFKVIAGIPVEANSPNVFGSFLIFKSNLGTVIHALLVMIPDHNLYMRQARLFQGRSQVITNKIFFFFGGVKTGIPYLNSLCFVLNTYGPNIDAFRSVSLNIFYEHVGPSLAEFRLKRSTTVHLTVRFHEGRWTPRRGEQTEIFTNSCCSSFD
ncbi:hypothetical protein D3C76_470950 [compost metagenome]